MLPPWSWGRLLLKTTACGERPAQDNSTDALDDLSCQTESPLPAGTFSPDDIPDQNTTGQSWEHLFRMPLDAHTHLGWHRASDKGMTPGKCGDSCCGSMYFGLHAGTECLCVDGPGHLAIAEASEGCTVRCGGDGKKMCGGEESADVFVVDQVASWEYCKAHQGNSPEGR